MNILVLDDEKEIADLVELFLINEGYRVFKFYESEPAMQCIESTHLDMALLDVMLPDTGGFAILRKIREKGLRFPVIMLTARVEDRDKIIGLSMGADDYITKPFNPLEMVSRVKAQLRRYTFYDNQQKNDNVFDYAGLVVNKDTHKCTLYEKEIALTPIEFNILWLLCENADKVVSAEDIFQQVWGEKYLDCSNTVMVHIRRIREKMNEPSRNPKFIKTVWGVGYKIETK